MKKFKCLPVIAMTMAIALTGCQGNTPKTETAGAAQESKNEGAAQEPKDEGAAQSSKNAGGTVRIGWWGNQVRNDATVKVIQMYMEHNPDTKIEYEFSDWGGYWDKLSTQAAGGTMPDIIQHDYSRIAQYVESGQLLDLTPYVESGALDLSNVPQSVIDTGKMQGGLYGLCMGTTSPAMVYDKKLVEEAGVTIPSQPTFDELYEISQKIYDKTGAKTLMDGTMTMMSMMARSEGTELMKTFETGDPVIAQKYYDMLERFSTPEWAISADILTEKNPDVIETKPIVDQTTWNDFTFSSMSIGISQAAGREIGIVMYPQDKDASNQCMYLKPTMFFCIPADSEQKDEAVAFLNWFINDAECNKILKADRGVPISTAVAEEVKEEMDDVSMQVFDFVDEVAKVASAGDPPSPAGFIEIEADHKTLVENIRYGQMEAEAAASQLAADAKTILSTASKQAD